jgi:hypothetical protein
MQHEIAYYSNIQKYYTIELEMIRPIGGFSRGVILINILVAAFAILILK